MRSGTDPSPPCLSRSPAESGHHVHPVASWRARELSVSATTDHPRIKRFPRERRVLMYSGRSRAGCGRSGGPTGPCLCERAPETCRKSSARANEPVAHHELSEDAH